MELKELKIPIELVKKIASYLQVKPFQEVAGLLSEMQVLIDKQEKGLKVIK
jgi:hypothetical protein